MKILIKFNSISSVLTDSFTLSADYGIVSPGTASKAELVSGIQVEVDASANNITITNAENTSINITSAIDKSVENCVDLSFVPIMFVPVGILSSQSANLLVGTPTPTPTPTRTPTPTPTLTRTPTPTPTVIYDTWQKINLGFPSWFGAGAYGNEKFVAIYEGDRFGHSSKGIIWQELDFSFEKYQAWSAITYGANKFVAIANYNSSRGRGQILSSPNGVDWEQSTLPVLSNSYWNSISYGGGKFVAVGGLQPGFPTNIALYSSDGITWQQSNLPASDGWTSVTYGGGKFVALGYTGKILYSNDGITWQQTNISGIDRYTSIVYGNNLFVAISSPSYAKSIYSSDGINWNVGGTIFDQNTAFGKLAYGSGRFIAVSSTSMGNTWNSKAAYSYDGITWQNANLMSNFQPPQDIVYGDGKFIIIAFGEFAYMIPTTPTPTLTQTPTPTPTPTSTANNLNTRVKFLLNLDTLDPEYSDINYYNL